MPLEPGTHLGPYEIVAQIGAGGMGVVYRARDSRLGRNVAIKVSAERFSERFSREAHAVAALNQPNVCTLYDVGPNYLVMELVEGDSPRGPLPLETALNYARQIAGALEAAHEKGIVHRDLKPANIKIKPDGTVKVLDFGLAKLSKSEAASFVTGEPEQLPDSTTLAATTTGVVLGTPAYMSPEQARGLPIDKRTDIWAFGIVLYELLTGQKLFDGEDVTETLAKVIQGEPDLNKVPGKVRRLLKKCLEKDPKRRLRDIADAWELLEEAPLPAPAIHRRLLPWLAAGVFAILAAAALWLVWRASQPVLKPLVRLEVDLGPNVALPVFDGSGTSVIVSPDGTRLAYISGNPRKLFTRKLDEITATELPGTEGASAPFFSTDGQWIGFGGSGKLSKISVTGGAPIQVGNLSSYSGGSWGDDGNIVAAQAYVKEPFKISEGGGTPATFTQKGTASTVFYLPQVLPGGKAVLFTVRELTSTPDTASIEVVSLVDGSRKTLIRGGTSGKYVPSGHLIYMNKGTLFAVPFDLKRLETRGTGVPVLDDVAYMTPTGTAQFAVSNSGILVYRRGANTGEFAGQRGPIQWLDNTGKRQPLRTEVAVYRGLRLSEDGGRLLFGVFAGTIPGVWVQDLHRDATIPLTPNPGGFVYVDPIWSADGRHVVYRSVGGGIYWTRADGGGQPQLLLQSNKLQLPGSFLPDGKELVYSETEANRSQLWTVPLTEEGGQLKAGTPQQILKTPVSDFEPRFSPDGRWLAYSSQQAPGAKPEVWVRPFPPAATGQSSQWLISTNGGEEPVWSRTMPELLYRSGDQIMSVSYTINGDTFVPGKPRVWIPKLGGTYWDLDPKGKRVAVATAVDTPEATKLDHTVIFLQNFFDELQRRAPVPK